MNKKLESILQSKEFFEGQTLLERMDFYHIPALSFAVVNDFRVDCSYAVGVKKYGENEIVTKNTLFQAGSISKQIFALAVMRLSEEHQIDLDEDINTYLSNYRVTNMSGDITKITARQILSHTAGMNVHGFDGYEQDASIPTVIQILNGEFPANSDKVICTEKPNMKFCYSGGGITILQKAVMDILHQDFSNIMNEYVLKPLQMNQSTYSQPIPPDQLNEIALGHFYRDENFNAKYYIMPEMAAAGLWSTPNNLAHYGIYLQEILQNNAAKIIKKETVDAMTSVQFNEVFPMEETNVQTGLGCFIKGQGENTRFGHGGHNEGYLSLMNFYKYKPQGSVIMINSDDGYMFLDELQKTIYAVYDWNE